MDCASREFVGLPLRDSLLAEPKQLPFRSVRETVFTAILSGCDEHPAKNLHLRFGASLRALRELFRPLEFHFE